MGLLGTLGSILLEAYNRSKKTKSSKKKWMSV